MHSAIHNLFQRCMGKKLVFGILNSETSNNEKNLSTLLHCSVSPMMENGTIRGSHGAAAAVSQLFMPQSNSMRVLALR